MIFFFFFFIDTDDILSWINNKILIRRNFSVFYVIFARISQSEKDLYRIRISRIMTAGMNYSNKRTLNDWSHVVVICVYVNIHSICIQYNILYFWSPYNIEMLHIAYEKKKSIVKSREIIITNEILPVGCLRQHSQVVCIQLSSYIIPHARCYSYVQHTRHFPRKRENRGVDGRQYRLKAGLYSSWYYSTSRHVSHAWCSNWTLNISSPPSAL